MDQKKLLCDRLRGFPSSWKWSKKCEGVVVFHPSGGRACVGGRSQAGKGTVQQDLLLNTD